MRSSAGSRRPPTTVQRAGAERARSHGRSEHGRRRGAAFRANGLRGLQNAFQETVDEPEASVAGETLLGQTQRLLASDIIWTDSFRAGRGGSAGGRDRGSRRPVLRVPHGGRPRDPERPGSGLASGSGRFDRGRPRACTATRSPPSRRFRAASCCRRQPRPPSRSPTGSRSRSASRTRARARKFASRSRPSRGSPIRS